MATMKETRKKVRDRYGRAMETKATDALCKVLAGAGTRMAANLEAMSVQPSLVLEFRRPGATRAALRPAASTEAWDAARWAAIDRRRNAFHKAIEDVRADLEKGASSRRRGATREESRRAVKVSWLISALRAPMEAKAVAEVAGHRDVRLIDVPRAIKPELDVTGVLVGTVAFRERTGKSGEGITVGVIDSEVATSHPAFGDRAIKKENFTAEPWGNPGSHGTAVAGIVGGEHNRFRGMAPGVTINSYKVIANDPALGGDDFHGALALERALEDRVRIANCSWGTGPAADGTSREAVACDEAWDLGLVIVKSAGNKGPGAGTMTTPADARGVIVVGATGRSGRSVADYSSRGPVNGRPGPDLLAPGGDDDGEMNSCTLPRSFGECGMGTSFAAPHVTGLLALLLEAEPTLTPDQLKAKLLGGCRRVEDLEDAEQGSGLLFIP
jgi:serine protease AprX